MSTKLDKSLILNTIKEHYNFKSDAEFARFLGIKPQTLASWHTRNTYDYELLYSKCVGLNGEFLLSGTGDAFPVLGEEKNYFQDTSIKYNLTQTPQVITVTPQNEDNVVLVDVKAQAGYLNGFNNPTFLKKLPTYNLPNIRNGIYRMFQIEGHSMYPTMHSNSYVVGQFVENWVNDIKDNKIYIIVSDNDGVVIKRVLNRIDKYNSLYCKSDNRKEYPSFTVDVKDIKEVWEVKLLLSYNLLDPAEIYDRVSDLEAEILHIKDLYSKKLNKK
jgi:phage repressor protein C with HTH and peptisase S24 domain